MGTLRTDYFQMRGAAKYMKNILDDMKQKSLRTTGLIE